MAAYPATLRGRQAPAGGTGARAARKEPYYGAHDGRTARLQHPLNKRELYAVRDAGSG